MHIDHTSVPIYGGTRLELALARALACQTTVITLRKEKVDPSVDLVPWFGTHRHSVLKIGASVKSKQVIIIRLLTGLST